MPERRPLAARAAVFFGLLLSACATAAPPSGETASSSEPSPEEESEPASPNFTEPAPENDSADREDAQVCATQVETATRVPSLVQFVVDTSGSMNDIVDGEASKWELTRQELERTFDSLPGTAQVGLTLFPAVPLTQSGPCFSAEGSVPLAELSDADSRQRLLLGRALAETTPEGGTPTHDAYAHALHSLRATEGDEERFVVLITDGNPTFSQGCDGTGLTDEPVDPSDLVVAARDARDNNVRTFVVGAPGSHTGGYLGEDPRTALSAMAEAGGTGTSACDHFGPNFCHLDMTAESEFAELLGNALAELSKEVLSCDYELPEADGEAGLDLTRLNVVLVDADNRATRLPQAPTRDDCDEGWHYTHNETRVALCPSTCERTRAGDIERVEIELGCATEVAVR